MLSRVAERIYWFARYIERIENTARLVQTHSQLMLDMPKNVDLTWYTLIEITSNESFFADNYDAKTEKNVCWALLGDRNNSASLMSSLWWARENVRTARDSLPRETWRYVNELYLQVKDSQDKLYVRSKRNELLEEVIRACQSIYGMLEGTMSYNNTYRFLLLGSALERADMTSRMLDVGAFVVANVTKEQEGKQLENILWANILKSVSAFFMYRQSVQIEINGKSVIRYLINDPELSRAIKHCVTKIQNQLNTLPACKEVDKAMVDLKFLVNEKVPFELGSELLHDYLDEIQQQLSEVHQQFYHAWFNHNVQQQTQAQQ